MLIAVSSAVSLPRCTIAVAGANGRVGSMVCRELLRNHDKVMVRALVRSASDPYQGYGRLSYEVGAEDGKMELRAAFQMDGETGRFAAPASIEFDEEVQGGYGLDRLEIRECELRYGKDVEDALADVDAVIWCATAFNAFRQRLPDRLDRTARSIDQRGMALFELRFGKALFGEEESEDGLDKQRRDAARDKTADVEGLQIAVESLVKTRRRRSTLAELTGGGSSTEVVPLVVLSAASCLGYEDDAFGGGGVSENEFGFRKRSGEEAVASSGLPHVIVRSAAIDDVRGEERLDLQMIEAPDSVATERIAAAGPDADAAEAVGVRDDEAKKRRIHPRDVARSLVDALEPGSKPGSESGRVVEVWTYEDKPLFS